MERKKWTAKTEVTDSVLQLREKRRWQIALRRYLLDRNKSAAYAPYFGLDIERFRQWIALQFTEELNWANFSDAWQFDHIVPMAYFDFKNEEDLRLCWNFTNIRVDNLRGGPSQRNRVDVLAAKGYFDLLYRNTGYRICQQMVEKLTRIEASEIADTQALQAFIADNKEYLKSAATLSADEFRLLNEGRELGSILYEKDFLKRLGS